MAERVDTLVRGTLVDVHTGTLEERPVAVDDGEVVALAERPADRVIETGYVAPGLIDSHVHVESSMVTLPRYGEAVIPHGVTAVVHDPHEIANVLGAAGVRAVLADAAHTPLKARFGVPSSVPASPLQDAGAELGPDAVADLLGADRVVALAEVMDVPGVVAGDEAVHAKIAAARERGLAVDGHMPRVTGDDLQEAARYLDTDHESIALPEAREKARAGLRLSLREGSSSEDVAALVGLVDEVDPRTLSFCSDDRDVIDLIGEGGVNAALETAISEGVDPVTAVQMATVNTAETYDLPFGRLVPGAPADLVLLSDLESWSVEGVMIDGVLDPTGGEGEPPPTNLATDTVRCDPVDPADLAHPAPDPEADRQRVRVVDPVEGIQTAAMEATVPVCDGALVADLGADVLPMAVVERHGGDGGIGTGFVHRLGLERGAIGSTVAHDAHNLVVAGADHGSMARVANRLREVGGGVAAYDPRADAVTELALPVAGLMADEPLRSVEADFREVERAAEAIGLERESGIMALSFLSLEVIPELRLTNNGLVDVREMAYVGVAIT